MTIYVALLDEHCEAQCMCPSWYCEW